MGKEKLNSKSKIIVANHQSQEDILLIYRLGVPFRWISKAEVFRIPIYGWLMHLKGDIKLQRSSRSSIKKMFIDSEKVLNKGCSITIFPEGTRSKTRELGNFKEGAFRLAQNVRVPIVPVVIYGTGNKFISSNFFFKGKHKVIIKILDEIPYSDFKDIDTREFANQIRNLIESELNQLKLSGLRKNLILLSFLRFFTFISAITLMIFLIKQFSLILLGLFFFFFTFFIFGVVYYLKKTEVLNHIKNLIKINKDEINVLSNDFSSFNDGVNYISREHAYSFDLDLFGEGSIFQYLNRTVSLVGRELLAKRILNINTNDLLFKNQQEAIKELTPKIDWRHNFMATGYSCPVTDDDNKKIEYWIDDPVYFIKSILFKILVVLLPVITLLFLVLLISGISHYSWFVLFALLQLLIASILLKRTNKEQSIVSEELRILKNYSKLIKLIENEAYNSETLKKLQNDLQTETVHAETAFKKLIRIIDAFDTRLNIFLGLILNATLMWDLYSLMRLERWKVKYGQNIKRWVQVIAEFDVYCSMANYSYNNPDFVYPQVSGLTVLDSEELGHPLIPRTKRVNNNFKIDKSGEIDIVTGANMAGKSTFLRTIGVNLILAMNGMPVCAKKFDFRLMDLFSGMRTADSLKENESYFYAELKRLKYIIEELKQGKTTFVLLDEILKGTNSADKAKGSWKFVEHLIKLKATGIVATHDLTLCNLEKKYPDNIKNKCFEVEIDADKIKFDYKLRPGVTQNMNASLLMRQMGIFSN